MASGTKPKCPVCDWEIDGKGIQVKTDKGTVTVCCDECAEKARKAPAKTSK